MVGACINASSLQIIALPIDGLWPAGREWPIFTLEKIMVH